MSRPASSDGARQAQDNSTAAFVIARAHEQGVETIALWLVDPEGRVHVTETPCEALDDILDAGFPLPPDAVPGAHGTHPGARLRPDPHTFQVLPRSDHATPPVARLLCDLQRPDGSPSPLCARSRLKATLARTSLGAKLYVGATLEHRWLASPGAPTPLTAPHLMRDLARRVVSHLEHLGIPWRSHSPSPRQRHDDPRWAFDLEWVDPLMLADSLVTHRQIVREVAQGLGRDATFMPHPWPAADRASLDLYLSSMDDGLPTFDDPLAPDGLSPIGAAVRRTLEAALPDLALALRPTVNSYTRPDTPRVGLAAAGRSESGPALVLAGVDACANPYLVLNLLIGVAHAAIADAHLAPTTTAHFPETLVEALRLGTASRTVKALLGDALVSALAATGRADAARWREQVTAWEVARYL
jgi:glutamine synthetase